MLKFYSFLIYLLFIYNSVLIAQPYIYKRGIDTTHSEEGKFPYYTFVSINKINLSDGKIEKIGVIDDDTYYLVDNTDTWWFEGNISWRGSEPECQISRIKNSNPGFMIGIQPDMAIYSKVHNKLFIGGIDREGYYVVVMNSHSGEEELRVDINNPSDEGNMFLSYDENKFYFSSYDSTFNPTRRDRIKVMTLSTSTNELIQARNLQDLGYPGSDGYSLSYGKKGKALIGSGFSKGGAYYNIYDFDKGSGSSFIYSPGYSEAYFTNNGKYIIVSPQTDSIADIGIPIHYHKCTGLFNIYDVSSRKLVKTLNLPPRREVKTFDNFPDNIYYYNDNTEKAITLNIDSLVNTPSGPTDSPKVIMYNVGTTYFIGNFINGKIKYELGTGFTIIKPEPSAGYKLIYNEYDEYNNLLGVFSFEKGYIKGTYTKDKNKKVLHFSRIDQEP